MQTRVWTYDFTSKISYSLKSIHDFTSKTWPFTAIDENMSSDLSSKKQNNL